MSEMGKVSELSALRRKSKNSSKNENPFKGSLFGLNRKEVEEYIKGLNSTIKSAQSSYDKKIAELQDIIAMLTREKEGYAAQNEKLNDQIEIIESDRRKMAVKLSALDEMTSNWERLCNENEIMTQKVKKYENSNAETEAVKKQLYDLSAKYECLEGQNRALNEKHLKVQDEKEVLTQHMYEQEKRYNSELSELKLAVFQTGRKNKYLTEQIHNSLKAISGNIETIAGSFDEFTNDM